MKKQTSQLVLGDNTGADLLLNPRYRRCVYWLVVFNVPSTAWSFRDGTPIYCPLRRT